VPFRPFSLLAFALAVFGTCHPSEAPPFPPNYETQWREARAPCTLSHDHELRWIRVFANDRAYEPYVSQSGPYPPGAILLKAEYDDRACTELVSIVVMEKMEPGATPPSELGWRWRRFGPDRREIIDPSAIPSTCTTCHEFHCREPPYGWDYTCPPGSIEPPPR
jgi:hypothetical protein